MRLEEIRQRFKDEFVLIAVTKTDEDNVEILEGDVLAHSPHRDEIMALLGGQTPPRHPLRQCIIKLTGYSREISSLGSSPVVPYARPMYYIV